MSRTIPYLQRRGDAFGFRIAVPVDLRRFLTCRELTKSLETGDRLLAEPRCLALAARAKQLFRQLRQMTKNKSLQDSGTEVGYTVKFDFNSEGFAQSVEIVAEEHERAAVIETVAALRDVLTLPKIALNTSGASARSPALSAADKPPMLFDLTSKFLEKYPTKHEAMLKKHQACIPAFAEFIGNKPVSELRHAHIQEFFAVIQRLPPRWADIKRREGVSIREIAARQHSVLISGKTFGHTYKTSINQFLSWAKESYRDQGFPEITIDKIAYEGTRQNGEGKQRAFTPAELKRLFEGPEMVSFAKDGDLAHQCWLPAIGLYTGARVNEICQMNPQTDILQEPDSGIWYFWLTGETDGDENVRKRTKNAVSTRTVPIHSALIEMGFLSYFERVKQAGATLLFPKWAPSKGRASPEAEKWFRKFLFDTGLRDDAPGKRIVGMHAFRHTLSNAAFNAGVDESSIVGHMAKGVTSIALGYRGALAMKNQAALLEAITFDVDLVPPV
jgi:integrase